MEIFFFIISRIIPLSISVSKYTCHFKQFELSFTSYGVILALHRKAYLRLSQIGFRLVSPHEHVERLISVGL